jgi:hypothetical protein
MKNLISEVRVIVEETGAKINSYRVHNNQERKVVGKGVNATHNLEGAREAAEAAKAGWSRYHKFQGKKLIIVEV